MVDATARLRALPLLALAWGVAAPAALAQVVEEPPPAVAGIVEEDLEVDLEELLAGAEELFASARQADSIPLYEQIVALLERRAGADRLDDEGRELLKRCRSRRAEAYFNLADQPAAEAELEAILALDPGYRLPEGRVSPKLVDLMEAVRAARVGVLDVMIDPPDAELLLDGEPLDAALGSLEVLAGTRRLVARQPGYTAVEMELEIPAGDALPVELVLERSSAVVRFEVRPAGAEVVYEGRVVAVSAAADDGLPPSAVVDGLEVGSRRLELRKAGFRSTTVELEIESLSDYTLAPVALEPSLGTVVLSEVPAGARLLVDGEPRPSAGERRLGLRLDLPPGAHRIEISAGSVGRFERVVELADRQLLEVAVRLRPALVLLGVLGEDRVAASRLEARLVEKLGALAEWALVDRAADGAALIRGAGIDRHRLRALASERGGGEPPDWQAFQGRVDGALGGSLYLLAVLSDDLVASHADLWLLAAAPGPWRPARRRISLEREGGLDELTGELDRPLRLTGAWLGARLFDSAAAGSPVVLSVAPDGPAASAGLRPGDRISAAGGAPLARARELAARVAALEPGSRLELTVGAGATARQAAVSLGTTPVVAPLAGGALLEPAVAARLASLEADLAAAELGWLVALNRGILLLRSGEPEGAVRTLRGISAPATAGVGQATVDYLLGVALLETDRARYRDAARDLIAGAVEGGARLGHHDGPLLAPRAEARLETLIPSP